MHRKALDIEVANTTFGDAQEPASAVSWISWDED